MKSTLILFFILFHYFYSICQDVNFDGYYVLLGVVEEIQNEKYISEGQFLVNNIDELLDFIEQPDSFILKKNSMRLLSFTTSNLKLLGLPFPDSVQSYDQINWNRKVSLYRGNDPCPFNFYISDADKNIFFYLKHVKIKMQVVHKSINTVSESGKLGFYSDKLYLLKFILSQRYLNAYEEEQLSLRVHKISCELANKFYNSQISQNGCNGGNSSGNDCTMYRYPSPDSDW